MNSGTQPTRPSLKRMKARAKEASNQCGIGLSQAFEAQAQRGGFSSAYEALREKRSPSEVAQRMEAKACSPVPSLDHLGGDVSLFQPCYGVVIGDIYWQLEIGGSGPELWRRDKGGVSMRRVSELGIFQALLKTRGSTTKAKHIWSTSTYGTYDIEALEGFTESDAHALSYHFGLPILGPRWMGDQQLESERLFLKSPAFSALRFAIRTERIRPGYQEWNRGLSAVWKVLVVLDDESFHRYGHDIVDALFAQRIRPSEQFKQHWGPLLKLIKAGWPRFGVNVATLRRQIAQVLSPELATRLIAH